MCIYFQRQGIRSRCHVRKTWRLHYSRVRNCSGSTRNFVAASVGRSHADLGYGPPRYIAEAEQVFVGATDRLQRQVLGAAT